ncbi:hypothetical protein ABVT39_024726 [Epinephelus coioides]
MQTIHARLRERAMHPSILSDEASLGHTTLSPSEFGCPLCPKFKTKNESVIQRHLKNHTENAVHFHDFSDFVTQLSAISPSVLLLGDFNYHTDNINCKHASEFLDLLDCLNLTQHVNFPTPNHGHTLDLVCSTGLTIQQLSSINLHISDHLAIILDIHLPTPLPKDKRIISFRNLKSISPQDFSASLSNNLSTFPPPLSDDPNELVNYYNNTLSSCLDQLAPIKTKSVSFTHSAPGTPPNSAK